MENINRVVVTQRSREVRKAAKGLVVAVFHSRSRITGLGRGPARPSPLAFNFWCKTYPFKRVSTRVTATFVNHVTRQISFSYICFALGTMPSLCLGYETITCYHYSGCMIFFRLQGKLFSLLSFLKF